MKLSKKIAGFFKSGFDLDYLHIRTAAFLYMGLPFLIFSLTWLSVVPAIIATACTMFILLMAVNPQLLKPKSVPEEALLNGNGVTHIHVSFWAMFLVMLAVGIWVWWSGIGGGFYQSGDFPYRNAIFRDLLTYEWPVIYGGEKGMLAYYIGFWLPAALVGKFYALFIDNSDILWSISNTALYLWTAIGIFLVMLMLFFNVKATSNKKILAAAIIFIFFSGMDVVGWFAAGKDGVIDRLIQENIHIEWWAKKISFPSGHLLQFSSFTTQLFWVFNQAVVTWLAVLTLFREQTPSNFVFIGMMSLFCGPIPFYGFFVLALLLGLRFVIRSRKHWKFAAISLISPENLLALVGIFPVCFTYFTGNTAATMTTGSKLLRFVPRLIFNNDGLAHSGVSPKRLWLFIAFLVLEFLLIAIIIAWHNRKDIVFWSCIAMLCVFPMVFTGAAADFCMRATIPALVLFCVYVIRFLFESWGIKKKSVSRLLCIVLAVFLAIGAVTPMVEMSRGIYKSVKAGEYLTYNDTFKTLNSSEKSAKSVKNFTAQNYENSKFYTYFARH